MNKSFLNCSNPLLTVMLLSETPGPAINAIKNANCLRAGAYGIQGLASKFIKGINGCYFNVVGLPVNLLYSILKELSGE